MNPVVLALTGASGSIYGRTLLDALLDAGVPVEFLVSQAGARVARMELDEDLGEQALRTRLGPRAELLRLPDPRDIGATIASGSYPVQGMVIAPCSMGTAGRIAAGVSSNLIERAADVQLKERRPLVLVVRETPLSTLHLEHLLKLSQAGATILPAAPGFYARPQGVADLVAFIVERALQHLRIDSPRTVRWEGDA